ncbi:MAG: hypothetical protein ACR2NR_07135 [Solirubrobacteraceae bacterium]
MRTRELVKAVDPRREDLDYRQPGQAGEQIEYVSAADVGHQEVDGAEV